MLHSLVDSAISAFSQFFSKKKIPFLLFYPKKALSLHTHFRACRGLRIDTHLIQGWSFSIVERNVGKSTDRKGKFPAG